MVLDYLHERQYSRSLYFCDTEGSVHDDAWPVLLPVAVCGQDGLWSTRSDTRTGRWQWQEERGSTSTVSVTFVVLPRTYVYDPPVSNVAKQPIHPHLGQNTTRPLGPHGTPKPTILSAILTNPQYLDPLIPHRTAQRSSLTHPLLTVPASTDHHQTPTPLLPPPYSLFPATRPTHDIPKIHTLSEIKISRQAKTVKIRSSRWLSRSTAAVTGRRWEVRVWDQRRWEGKRAVSLIRTTDQVRRSFVQLGGGMGSR